MFDLVNRHAWLFRACIALYLQIWCDFLCYFIMFDDGKFCEAVNQNL